MKAMPFASMAAVAGVVFATQAMALPAADIHGRAVVPVAKSAQLYNSMQDRSVIDSIEQDLGVSKTEIRTLYLNGQSGSPLQALRIPRNKTAEAMLDRAVFTPAGKKIAWVRDIIVDRQGKAALVVLSYGGLLGVYNKLAAFNYDRILSQGADGKITMNLTQDMVWSAPDFSYDPLNNGKPNGLPAGGVSVNNMLNGHLLDYKGREVADIENVSFMGGQADQVIVGFNKNVGLDGDLASLDYSMLGRIERNDAVSFQMNEAQSAQFSGIQVSARN